jgi:UDP-glucose 4-epimerase
MTSTTTATIKRILVTGGCGYIGSHTLVSLLNSDTNISVVVVDDLVNSSVESLRRVADITNLEGGFIIDTPDNNKNGSTTHSNAAKGGNNNSGQDKSGRLVFRKVDCTNSSELRTVFDEYAPSGGFAACIHFAGLKAVGESKIIPLSYYQVNIGATWTLLSLMEEYGCRSIVFSSSATVYGIAKDETAKLKESDEVGVTITNCYGRTKYMIEQILHDFHISQSLDGENKTPWNIVILRYFNPAGAHPSGKMGEDPRGVPNNLMPFVAQVAVGHRPHVTIFGNDYDTHDGTGIRDYLHVMDLADGHVAALRYANAVVAPDVDEGGCIISSSSKSGRGKISTFNLGTGTGYSVLDMVNAFSKAIGRQIPTVMGPREFYFFSFFQFGLYHTHVFVKIL